MQNNSVYKDIFNAENNQFKTIDDYIADLNAQLSVDTATWGLDIYERELGIVIDYSKPYPDRRSVVKGKLRGSGKVDATLIKIVTVSFTNGDVEVSFDGQITVEFNSVRGIPPNLDDLKAALEEIKPAHLAIAYVLKYLIWNELDSMALSWDEFDALNLTWDQLEGYNPTSSQAGDSLNLLFID